MKLLKSGPVRIITVIVMVLALCIVSTGCMGGQRDIKKSEEAEYEAMISAACDEYGYEYDQQVVLPKGSALLYVLTDDEEGMTIEVRIDEESVYDKVSCEFEIRTDADSAAGIEPHLDVALMIAANFTDELTKDELVSFLNDDSWIEGKGEDEFLKSKTSDSGMVHMIETVDSTADEYKEGDPLQEVFTFGWDNGKKYKLKQD